MIEGTNYKLIFAILAIIISFSNFIFYIWSVFKRDVTPHAYTWVIWGIITVIAFFAQLEGNGGYALIHLGFVGFACFTIAILGLLKGKHLIIKSDIYCLVLCLLAIILWLVTENLVLSVLIITGVDLAAFYPSVRKSWNAPYNENNISFFLYGVCFSLQILAIESYNFLTTFYPFCIALSATLMAVYLTVRRIQVPKIVK